MQGGFTMSDYPKLLIINDESLYKKNATGITLRSLIKSWPSQAVIEFHLWKPSVEEDESIDLRAYLIPREVFPLNKLLRKITRASQEGESRGISFGGVKSTNPNNNLKSGIKEYAKYLGESKCIDISPVISILRRESFIPDVIYTMGSRFAMHKLTTLLAQYYGCGTCFHFMDNWRETAFKNTPIFMGLNRKLNDSIAEVICHSNTSLVISPLMKSAYEKKYGGNYSILMNSVKIENPCLFEDKDCLLFSYAGGLHLNRYKSLLQIQKVIGKLSIAAKLLIYTNSNSKEKYGDLFDKSITEFREFVPHDRVREIYEEADVLIHVESFDPEQIEYTKYSLSTKIPEYMSSGKPILCYAPENISVYQYVETSGGGLCASTEKDLLDCIVQLAENKQLRKNIGEKGFQQALLHHDIIAAQTLFLNVIKSDVKRLECDNEQ